MLAIEHIGKQIILLTFIMFYFISDLLEMLQTSRNVQTLKFYVVQ